MIGYWSYPFYKDMSYVLATGHRQRVIQWAAMGHSVVGCVGRACSHLG